MNKAAATVLASVFAYMALNVAVGIDVEKDAENELRELADGKISTGEHYSTQSVTLKAWDAAAKSGEAIAGETGWEIVALAGQVLVQPGISAGRLKAMSAKIDN